MMQISALNREFSGPRNPTMLFNLTPNQPLLPWQPTGFTPSNFKSPEMKAIKENFLLN